MSDTSNKQRLLRIMEIFEKETDENHELSVEDIIGRLEKVGINQYKCGAKAVKDDIRTLIHGNFGIVENQDKYGKKYFKKQNRKFETYELRLLIDAICSARFMSPYLVKELIKKIKTLTSKHLAAKLNSEIYMDETIIYAVPELKYNLDKLHTALQDSKIVKFQYGTYNLLKQFTLHHNGDYYTVHPYGLVWNNGFYYLVAKNLERNEIINYRVDRMRQVDVAEQGFDKHFFDLATHVKRCFNMYPGDVRLIQVKFHKHLINAIIDRFGKDADIQVYGQEYFVLTTEAAINTGLVRWLLTWGSDAEVLRPEELVQEIKQESEKIYQIYHK